jgi:ABC-type Fe3+/spermidine/putrescine transport system ATPase subunit
LAELLRSNARAPWSRRARPASGDVARNFQGGSAVRIEGVRKRFKTFEALSGVSFTVEAGSFTTILGASGSGKTTILRLLAGLENLDDGRITIGSETVSSARPAVHKPPEQRRVGFVFQNYALWPHMTIFEQVAYPLQARGQHDGIDKRVRDALTLVGLSGLADRYPSELSGGQQQRVSVARAVVYQPEVLLLDEPLSNLDAELRDYMRGELQALHRRIGMTMLYVTHDQAEALTLSDHVVVMSQGKLIEEGTPREIYERPRSSVTARFVGASNMVSGVAEQCGPDGDGQGLVALDCGIRLAVPAGGLPAGIRPGDQVTVAMKPEDIDVVPDPAPGLDNTCCGLVRSVAYLGSHHDLLVDVGEENPATLRVRAAKNCVTSVGDVVGLFLGGDRLQVFGSAPVGQGNGSEAEEGRQ